MALRVMYLPAVNELPLLWVNHTSTENAFPKHLFGRFVLSLIKVCDRCCSATLVHNCRNEFLSLAIVNI